MVPLPDAVPPDHWSVEGIGEVLQSVGNVN
jgi:hypothetical protein